MAEFSFKGMTIDRLIAHTIHPRGPDKKAVQPTCSEALIPMNDDVRELTQLRITEALSHSSHGVEVGCENSAVGSFMQVAAELIDAHDARFVQLSKALAGTLTANQVHGSIPGGVLIIVSGTVGLPSKRFLAAIKAETDKGFNVEERNGVITLQVVKRMLLSQTQRLFKIGLVVEVTAVPRGADGLSDPANYRYFLFDHLLTATETRPAAAYFYSAFLGMSILATAKHHTRIFFDETRSFINSRPIPEDDKRSMLEALRTTLRANTPTISAHDFADEHLPEEMRGEYVTWVNGKGFPRAAVVKDIDYIKFRLRRPRQMLFSSGVSIRVPADQDLGEHVAIEGSANGFTTVKIKGTIQDRD